MKKAERPNPDDVLRRMLATSPKSRNPKILKSKKKKVRK